MKERSKDEYSGKGIPVWPVQFQPSSTGVTPAHSRVRLSVSLLKLLSLFLKRAGQLITCEEIALALWEDSSTVDTVTGINPAVRRLRAQLNDDPSAPKYVEPSSASASAIASSRMWKRLSPRGMPSSHLAPQ